MGHNCLYCDDVYIYIYIYIYMHITPEILFHMYNVHTNVISYLLIYLLTLIRRILHSSMFE